MARRKRSAPFTIGLPDKHTSYLKGRDIDFTAYLADGESDQCEGFPSLEVRTQVYEEGETLLRLEEILKGAVLAANGRATAESWRRYGEGAAYSWARELMNRRLKLGVKFRARKPKPEDLAKLPQTDRAMAEMHLRGEDPFQHPAVQAHATVLERQKYFSAVKRRVLNRLRIDFDLEWEDQVKVANANLDQILARGLYEIPPELAPHCFSRTSAQERIRLLRYEVLRRFAMRVKSEKIRGVHVSRLALIDVGPPDYDCRLIDFDRVDVSDEARCLLSTHDRPLYPLLHCHGLGVFGDLPLWQVQQNLDAIERCEPVHSMFKMGHGAIWITTTYRADPETGELRPFVRVDASGMA